MKVLVGAFNQEKALVGAFSVIVQPVVEPMEHYTALVVPLVPVHREGGPESGIVDGRCNALTLYSPTHLYTKLVL